MSTDPRNHRIDYLELSVADTATLGQAKRFYQAAFGWVYKDWGDEYADTPTSGLQSGVTVERERIGKPLPVLFATDLEATLAQVTAAGGVIVRDIFPFPGGRRFHFRDPAGNELGVWSDR